MAAGDYSASARLEEAVFRAEERFPNSPIAAQYDYTTRISTLQAIDAEGQVTLAEAADTVDNCKYKVHWVDECTDGTTNGSIDLCDLAVGAEPETNIKEYTLTQVANRSFSIDTQKGACNHVDNEEAFMRSLMKHVGDIHVEIAQYAAGIVDANKGQADLSAVSWTQATPTSHIVVPTADFDSSMMGQLAKVKRMTRMQNPYALSFGPLYEDFVMSGLDSGNNQNTEAARFAQLGRTYFDLENAASADADALYLINPSTLKFVSHSYNATRDIDQRFNNGEFNDSIDLTINSPWIPGLTMDLYYKRICSTASNRAKKYVDAYAISVTYDVLVAPKSECNDNYTGVWSFHQGPVA